MSSNVVRSVGELTIFCPASAAVFITVLCIILANFLPELLRGHPAAVVPCAILTLLCGVCVVIIWRQPESKEALTFKVVMRSEFSSNR